MSILISLSEHFYSVCSRLANGVEATKGIAQYVAQTNFNVVGCVFSVIGFVIETLWAVVEQGLFYLQEFVSFVTNLLHCVGTFVDSILSFVFVLMSGIYSSVLDVYNGLVSFNCSIVSSLSIAVFSVKSTMTGIYDSIGSAFFGGLLSFASLISSICAFLVGVGKFCVSVVTGAWHCLGYLLSSIAYLPVYCFECVESLKNQITHNIVDAFTAMPKETYLIMICLCLLYFTVSNAVRYVNSHGIRKLFSSRLRSSRMRASSNVDWQLDIDFESDYEDLYGDDANANNRTVWMIPGTADGMDRGGDNGTVSENVLDSSDDNGSDTTIDDDEDDDSSSSDISDDDDDEDDDRRVIEVGWRMISDDSSDSDTSLTSQTTASSGHEIEVSLPDMNDRYYLRSRSSTPSSCFPKIFSSPEEFEREMEKEKDKRKCVVCQDQVKSVLVMPCRHMCMCVLCADQIVKSRSVGRRVCPLCRTKIQKVMSVYV